MHFYSQCSINGIDGFLELCLGLSWVTLTVLTHQINVCDCVPLKSACDMEEEIPKILYQ